MGSALERHDEILRATIESHRAGDAAAAAIAAQMSLSREMWPAETQIRVRIGLHTGEAQERDGAPRRRGTGIVRAAVSVCRRRFGNHRVAYEFWPNGDN